MSESKFIKLLFDKNTKSGIAFPDKEFAYQFIDQLFLLVFIPRTGQTEKLAEFEKKFRSLKSHLSTLVYDVVKDGNKAQSVAEVFFEAFPSIYDSLLKDASVVSQYDPAAQSMEEVLITYPGFYATAVYRIAHNLWKQGAGILPRLFTEYAHSKTGIDIHPGAEIGDSFFIDHGTGIVIGETTVIGNNVKIYQGVTLGALNTSKDKAVSLDRRHPTIEDNVIIYPGAAILGGKAMIGHDSIIGANVWITDKIPPFSLVSHKSEISAREKVSVKEAGEDIFKVKDKKNV
ncbi:MAG: serine acetyltransferase [Chitinophagaceae bacterium]|nr:serine acetyltransferase [Chitinophagaceae bacterium]